MNKALEGESEDSEVALQMQFSLSQRVQNFVALFRRLLASDHYIAYPRHWLDHVFDRLQEVFQYNQVTLILVRLAFESDVNFVSNDRFIYVDDRIPIV